MNRRSHDQTGWEHDAPTRVDLVICDDHGMFACALAEALSDRADVLAVTRSPTEASEVLAALRPDVCLMGARYDGVERLDLLAQVRRASPGTRMLLMVTTPSTGLWRAYDSGAIDAVVSKSCTLQVMERCVSRASGGDRFTVGIDRASATRASRGHVPLTARERDVLAALVSGATTVEMAASLGISVNTVRTHVQHLLDKMGVANRVQAVRRAVEHQLLEPSLALQP